VIPINAFLVRLLMGQRATLVYNFVRRNNNVVFDAVCDICWCELFTTSHGILVSWLQGGIFQIP
jgi:hypothetical protein